MPPAGSFFERGIPVGGLPSVVDFAVVELGNQSDVGDGSRPLQEPCAIRPKLRWPGRRSGRPSTVSPRPWLARLRTIDRTFWLSWPRSGCARGQLHDAFALYTRAVSAVPDRHRYKERFLDLASRGLDVVAHSEQLETAIVACLKTPDLAGAVENWSCLLMADPDFQAVYGLRSRQALILQEPITVTTIRPCSAPCFSRV